MRSWSEVQLHPPKSPEFYPGEIWYDGEDRPVAIMQVVGYPIKGPRSKWDYDVVYRDINGIINKKNVWNFQVCYMHRSDLMLKMPRAFYLGKPLLKR